MMDALPIEVALVWGWEVTFTAKDNHNSLNTEIDTVSPPKLRTEKRDELL